MRTLILLSHFLFLSPLAYATDERPTIRITKVEQGKQDKMTLLDFYIKAKDDNGISKIEYRAAVDGKRSGWVKFPYYDNPGFVNHLPFQVDCNIFVLEIRSIDKNQNKSRIVKRTYTNLR
jgi:hypothetical protein